MAETSNSFIANVNALATKLDIIIESNDIFDEGVIPILQEIADLDLQDAIDDLRKGNYLGNRKIDINLSLNMIGIEADTDPDEAEAIWTNPVMTVQYSKAVITFADGVVLDIPFIFDGNLTTVSTHGDLLIQLNSSLPFLDKLNNTLVAGFATPVVGEIVRFYDMIGSNSNVERIVLHADSGSFKEAKPIYYWGKTTSAFQTLSMRAGDIIKIGNEIDNIIALANSIEQLLELEIRIPQLVDRYVDGMAQGDITIYNKLRELLEVHTELLKIIEVYDDIKTDGNNYIKSVAQDIQTTQYIRTVAEDINLGSMSNVIRLGSNIETIISTYNNMNSINSVSDELTNVVTVASNISSINIVNTDITKVANVSNKITEVVNVANNLSEINETVTTIIPNITAILNSASNANTAAAQAIIATNQATIATNKANEIKSVAVASTTTGIAGSLASVVYNSATGKFSFVIPQGSKGDKGDSFQVNAVGEIANRSIYDGQAKGFSFLAIDEGAIYFKSSSASGDWSIASPFGKGDKGNPGDVGNGVIDIVFLSTTATNGLAAQSGATDTYQILFTNGTSTTFPVFNGITMDGPSIKTLYELEVNKSLTSVETLSFKNGGVMSWNSVEYTADLQLNPYTSLQIGQETVVRVRNDSASVIENGDVVMAVGTTGVNGRIKVAKFSGLSEDAIRVIGIATHQITIGNSGFCTHFGKVRDINASGVNNGEVWEDGAVLYATVNGKLSNIKPTNGVEIPIAFVIDNSTTTGTIFVRVNGINQSTASIGTVSEFEGALNG